MMERNSPEKNDSEEKFTIELIVANHFGVLNRITGLYARRGYNIDSLNVNETSDPQFSRMLIMSRGDTHVMKQMVRQLGKLFDVREITLMAKIN